jgi:histidine triad (HIT) family protein
MVAQQQGQPQGQQQYTPEQIAEIKKKLASMDPKEVQEMIKKQCVFCKILAGEIPSYKVYEDKKVLAFLDIQPANSGHVLIIPKEHYSVLPQMPEEEVAHLFSITKQISGIVFDAFGAHGVEIRQRNGQAAGQVVPHVHVHVIPRFEDDKVPTDWEPKKLSENDFKKVQEQLAKLASSVKYSAPATKVVEKIVQAPAPQPISGPAPKKKKAPKKTGPKYKRRTP